MKEASKKSPSDPDKQEQERFSEARELLKSLLKHFDNNRSKLATALAIDESLIDEWIEGSSSPNTSSIMRMRMLAQERGAAS